MENKTITISNSKLKKLLEQKGELLTEGREISKKIDDLTQERAKFGEKLQKVKNKILPIMAKEVSTEEFEELGTVEINNDGDIEVTIFDMVESFKEQVRTHRSQNEAGKKG